MMELELASSSGAVLERGASTPELPTAGSLRVDQYHVTYPMSEHSLIH